VRWVQRSVYSIALLLVCLELKSDLFYSVIAPSCHSISKLRHYLIGVQTPLGSDSSTSSGFTNDVFSLFVSSQSKEDGLTKLFVAGPLGKLD
jgi:hypothetical protein